MNQSYYPTKWPVIGRYVRYWVNDPPESLALSLILAILAIGWMITAGSVVPFGLHILAALFVLASLFFLVGITFLILNQREVERIRAEYRKKNP